jgi:hypothetical protein
MVVKAICGNGAYCSGARGCFTTPRTCRVVLEDSALVIRTLYNIVDLYIHKYRTFEDIKEIALLTILNSLFCDIFLTYTNCAFLRFIFIICI